MASSRERRHICADFRDQRLRHVGAHPWDGMEEVDGLGQKRVGALVPWSWRVCGRAGHGLGSWVVWASPVLEEDAWDWGHVAGQGRLAWRRIRFTVGARLEHASIGWAQLGGGDWATREVRRFQECLDAVRDRGAITCHALPMARQCPAWPACGALCLLCPGPSRRS
jgi:hypothetical protein